MNDQTIYFLFLIFKVLSMLFTLRFLMQLSAADYYHPLTQSVLRLTNRFCDLPYLRNLRYRGVHYSALLISLVLCEIPFIILYALNPLSLINFLLFGLLFFLKACGFLLFCLLIVQALCSWLPITQGLSYLIGQITYPFVRPIQKIIPPIGMIDLSLMIFLFILLLINKLMLSIFGYYWYIL